MGEIAQGFRTIMEMIGVNPEEHWDVPFMGQKSISETLDTPEKVALFNEAIEESLNASKSEGITGFKAADAAMQAAGAVILGMNRPEDPRGKTAAERLLVSASPILRRYE